MEFKDYVISNNYGEVLENISIKNLTTIGCGGRVKYLYLPNNINSLAVVYKYINNMNYQDYFRKYLLNDKLSDLKKLNYDTSLHSIANYLKHNNNYKIYHTLDDYFTDLNQLKALKSYSKNKLVLIDHGSHLGFLYRQEFLDSFKNDVAQVLKQNI